MRSSNNKLEYIKNNCYIGYNDENIDIFVIAIAKQLQYVRLII